MRQLWISVYLPSFLVACGQQAVVILLPLYALHLGGGPAFAATVLTLRGAGSMSINLPAGLLVARFGDRSVMIVALLGIALAAAGIAISDGAVALSVCAFLYGASSGAWLLARLTFVSEVAPLAYRGRALAALGGMQRVGMLVGPVVGGVLAARTGYDAAFAAAAATSMLALLLVIAFSARQREDAAALPAQAGAPGVVTGGVVTGGVNTVGVLTAGVPAGKMPDGQVQPPGWRTLVAVIRSERHTFATAGVAAMGLSVLRSSRALVLPVWGATLGLDEARIGMVFMVSSLVEIAMSYPAGALLDRKGHKFAALPCFGLLALSMFLLPLAEGFVSLAAVAVVAGIGNGFGAGIMMTMGSDYAPRGRRGEFLGVWRMMGDGGQMAGPMLVGLVAAASSLAVGTVVAGVVGILGMLVMVKWVRSPIRV